jgi:hypothetical protein
MVPKLVHAAGLPTQTARGLERRCSVNEQLEASRAPLFDVQNSNIQRFERVLLIGTQTPSASPIPIVAYSPPLLVDR